MLDLDEIKTDSNLEQLGMDSFDKVELQMAIEDEFNVVMIEEDFDNKIKTFGDLLSHVEKSEHL